MSGYSLFIRKSLDDVFIGKNPNPPASKDKKNEDKLIIKSTDKYSFIPLFYSDGKGGYSNGMKIKTGDPVDGKDLKTMSGVHGPRLFPFGVTQRQKEKKKDSDDDLIIIMDIGKRDDEINKYYTRLDEIGLDATVLHSESIYGESMTKEELLASNPKLKQYAPYSSIIKRSTKDEYNDQLKVRLKLEHSAVEKEKKKLENKEVNNSNLTKFLKYESTELIMKEGVKKIQHNFSEASYTDILGVKCMGMISKDVNHLFISTGKTGLKVIAKYVFFYPPEDDSKVIHCDDGESEIVIVPKSVDQTIDRVYAPSFFDEDESDQGSLKRSRDQENDEEDGEREKDEEREKKRIKL